MSIKKIINEKFPRIPYQEAMKKYGTDKPDLRNPLLVYDLTHIFTRDDVKFDMVFVATGILHNDDDIFPEKSIKDINADKLKRVLLINTIGPTLVGKYFIPYLNNKSKSIFAFLSARVGSISENKLGGWYSYRSSKTALNQIIKNFSIEIKRTNPNAIFVGLQPGTVSSFLSKPFEKNVKSENLFTPDFSASKLLEVIDNLESKDTGKLIAWNGEEIQP